MRKREAERLGSDWPQQNEQIDCMLGPVST